MRIMYVEDNQVNLALVERIAKMGGHDVVSYENGADALAALQNDDCHLILMDIELEGEIDGIEVVKRLRARGDKRPIIAVTAYAMVGDMERILEAGCDEYLPKPIPIAQFLQLLAKYDHDNIQPVAKTSGSSPPQTTPQELPVSAPETEAKPVAATKPEQVTTPDDKSSASSSQPEDKAEKKSETKQEPIAALTASAKEKEQVSESVSEKPEDER